MWSWLARAIETIGASVEEEDVEKAKLIVCETCHQIRSVRAHDESTHNSLRTVKDAHRKGTTEGDVEAEDCNLSCWLMDPAPYARMNR